MEAGGGAATVAAAQPSTQDEAATQAPPPAEAAGEAAGEAEAPAETPRAAEAAPEAPKSTETAGEAKGEKGEAVGGEAAPEEPKSTEAAEAVAQTTTAQASAEASAQEPQPETKSTITPENKETIVYGTTAGATAATTSTIPAHAFTSPSTTNAIESTGVVPAESAAPSDSVASAAGGGAGEALSTATQGVESTTDAKVSDSVSAPSSTANGVETGATSITPGVLESAASSMDVEREVNGASAAGVATSGAPAGAGAGAAPPAPAPAPAARAAPVSADATSSTESGAALAAATAGAGNSAAAKVTPGLGAGASELRGSLTGATTSVDSTAALAKKREASAAGTNQGAMMANTQASKQTKEAQMETEEPDPIPESESEKDLVKMLRFQYQSSFCTVCATQLWFPPDSMIVQCPQCRASVAAMPPTQTECFSCHELLSHPINALFIQCPKCFVLMNPKDPDKKSYPPTFEYKPVPQSKGTAKKRKRPHKPNDDEQEAFRQFCYERWTDVAMEPKQNTAVQIMKTLTKRWRQLNPVSKQVYYRIAQDDSEEHKKKKHLLHTQPPMGRGTAQQVKKSKKKASRKSIESKKGKQASSTLGKTQAQILQQSIQKAHEALTKATENYQTITETLNQNVARQSSAATINSIRFQQLKLWDVYQQARARYEQVSQQIQEYNKRVQQDQASRAAQEKEMHPNQQQEQQGGGTLQQGQP